MTRVGTSSDVVRYGAAVFDAPVFRNASMRLNGCLVGSNVGSTCRCSVPDSLPTGPSKTEG